MNSTEAKEVCEAHAARLCDKLSNYNLSSVRLKVESAMLGLAIEIIRMDIPKKCLKCDYKTTSRNGICPACGGEEKENL